MRRVLVAEDAEMARRALTKMLELNGYDVAGTAEDGEQAIKAYRRLRPDIVLMDIAMPKKHGIDAAREILAYDPRAKIIAVTALYSQQKREEVIKAGILAIVTKPFDVGDLLKTLDDVMATGGEDARRNG